MHRTPPCCIALICAVAWGFSATPSTAQVVRQWTDDKTAVSAPGALDDAGSAVFAGTSADPDGTNPEREFQVVRFDPVSGAALPLTDNPGGTAALVSVSDDGQWLAFASPADLSGANHDRSSELFVMASDGTQVSQLTSDPAPNAGSVGALAISGDAGRVVFTSNTDPLGTNPDQLDQLFVIDRDGTSLLQLTQSAGGSFGGISISDDGSRVAFAHDGDLTGGNADLGQEVFAVDATGANLRQLTSSPAGFGSGAPALSGNGQRIALQSNADLTGGNAANQDEIFVIDWTGAGLAQVTTTSLVIGITGDPAAQSPSITDDGSTIFFHSNHSRLFPVLNLDGNFEIYRINADGSGRTVLTSTLLQAGSFLPVVAGGGGRVTYLGVDSEVRLRVMDGNGGGDVDLLTYELVFNGQPDVSGDGDRIAFVKTTGLFGGDQIWRVDRNGIPVQVTSLASGGAAAPSLTGDGATIVFSADSDPVGQNADLSEEIFRVQADGSGLQQLTAGPADSASLRPVVAAGAAVVVFDSDADPTGGNPDRSREIFAVQLDGSGLLQLTNGLLDSTSRRPRVDANGTWVVFESNADLDGGNADGSFEVFRVRADGSSLERITGDPSFDSGDPDVSAAGDVIVFSSASDPLGANGDLNSELFAYEPATATLRQLTAFAEGGSAGARISGNGNWVYFSSNAPVFETDPDSPTDLFRVPASGGAIERVGALRAGAIGGLAPIDIGGGGAIQPDDSGDVAAFTGIGDFTGHNPDLLPELWVIDRAVAGSIVVGAESPTRVSWTHESGPLRYDLIRGDVAALGGDAIQVDLGPVVCLEDDSPDADSAGNEDAELPALGSAFFYVYRGSQGLTDGPGSYGTSSDGRERVAGAGDCVAN